jgi:hypothetical protein
MSGLISTAGGVTLSIGSANSSPLTTTLADFEADSYVEVGEVEDAGQVGDESAAITFTALKDGRVRKLKGPRDAGTMAIVTGKDIADDGQEAMIAAEGTTFDYNIRLQLNDPQTLSGEGTIYYFAAKVMSKRTNVGNVSNVIKDTFNLGVNTAIAVVPAT